MSKNIERSSDIHYTQISQAYAIRKLSGYKEHITHTKICSIKQTFSSHWLCNEVEQNNSSVLYTLQRQFRLYIPFLGIARPQTQFPHSCVFERFIYSQDQSTYFLQQNRQTHRGNISFAHRHMKVEIGTEAPIFLFWKYLFQIFGILSLQCTEVNYKNQSRRFLSQSM